MLRVSILLTKGIWRYVGICHMAWGMGYRLTDTSVWKSIVRVHSQWKEKVYKSLDVNSNLPFLSFREPPLNHDVMRQNNKRSANFLV